MSTKKLKQKPPFTPPLQYPSQVGIRVDMPDLEALSIIGSALGLGRSAAARYAIRAVAQQIRDGSGDHKEAAAQLRVAEALGVKP